MKQINKKTTVNVFSSSLLWFTADKLKVKRDIFSYLCFAIYMLKEFFWVREKKYQSPPNLLPLPRICLSPVSTDEEQNNESTESKQFTKEKNEKTRTDA